MKNTILNFWQLAKPDDQTSIVSQLDSIMSNHYIISEKYFVSELIPSY